MKIGNMEVYGVIYKITNKINGKMYIGQTHSKNGFNSRYNAKGIGIERVYNYHCAENKRRNRGNNHLIYSIEKYGFDNFEVCKIFDVAFSQQELDIKEDMYINYYNLLNADYGYNLKGNTTTVQKSLELTKKQSMVILGWDIESYKKDIIRMYVDDKMSCVQIGNIYNVCSGTISKWLDIWGIHIKTQSEILIGYDISKHIPQIIDDYIIKNKTLYDISQLYGVSTTCIRSILDNNNVERKSLSETLIGYDINDYKMNIIDDYDNHVTSKEICKKYNISSTTLNGLLHKWSVPIHSKTYYTSGNEISKYTDDIINMYSVQKMSPTNISRHFGVGRSTIDRILHKNNIETSNKKAITIHDITNDVSYKFNSIKESANWLCNVLNNKIKFTTAKDIIIRYSKNNKTYKNYSFLRN